MIWLLACTGAPLDTGWALPDVADLPAQVEPPNPLVGFHGDAVDSVDAWESWRRPELVRLFEHYVYGAAQPLPPVGAVDARWLTDDVVELHTQGAGVVLVFVPPGPGPHPVLLGLNKCGNASVTDLALVSETTGYTEATCDDRRGSRSALWSVDQALAAGVAVATVHQSAFAPDDRDQGAHVIATWAAGLSLAVSALAQSDLALGPVGVFGHSRRGKAALVAAAADPRIDVVFPHQSGTGGQALSRGSTGETVDDVTTLFPHWFSPTFARFAGREDLLPVDQHLLIALVAPRRVVVRDGDDDPWANPQGARDAVELSQPVFELVGGDASWSSRPGDHGVLAQDWAAWAQVLASE